MVSVGIGIFCLCLIWRRLYNRLIQNQEFMWTFCFWTCFFVRDIICSCTRLLFRGIFSNTTCPFRNTNKKPKQNFDNENNKWKQTLSEWHTHTQTPHACKRTHILHGWNCDSEMQITPRKKAQSQIHRHCRTDTHTHGDTQAHGTNKHTHTRTHTNNIGQTFTHSFITDSTGQPYTDTHSGFRIKHPYFLHTHIHHRTDTHTRIFAHRHYRTDTHTDKHVWTNTHTHTHTFTDSI